MNRNERFDALQSRWAAGEKLTPEENAERLEAGRTDPLAQRELEIFEALRARGTGVEQPPSELVERVLEAVRARPRLQLLNPGEQRPVSQPRARLARRRALVAAAISVPLAAVAALAMFVRQRPEPAPVAAAKAPAEAALARSELVLASGEVEVPAPARVGGRPLAAGDRVSTKVGRACLGIDPGIDVCLGAHSEVTIESLQAEAVRVRVERGTALAALSGEKPGRSFALSTGDVSATARGTVFAVERDTNGSIDVVVMEGSVEVARGARALARVPAHSRLALAQGAVSSKPTGVGRNEEARFWALLGARALWAKPELGVLEIASGERGLEVAVDREAPLDLPFRGFVPAGRRSISLRTPAGEVVRSEIVVHPGQATVVDPRELFAERPAATAASTAPSAAALLAEARQALAAGSTKRALVLYERLRAAHPGSPEARTVLVTIGKLELDLGRPARALSNFDAYLKGGGALGPEALAGRIRALRALGRTAEERSAIETYLARYPDGFESPLLEQRLQVLQKR